MHKIYTTKIQKLDVGGGRAGKIVGLRKRRRGRGEWGSEMDRFNVE